MNGPSFLKRTHLASKRSAGMIVVVILLLSVQTGCTWQRIYENLYEGIRVRNELQTPPPERVEQQMLPNYWQYQNSLRRDKSDEP